MAFRKLISSSGCTAPPCAAPFPYTTLFRSGQTDCYKVSGLNAGDQLRVRVIETSGSLLALEEHMPDNRTPVCTVSRAVHVTCGIDTTGTHTILIEDNIGTNTGNYVIAVQRL